MEPTARDDELDLLACCLSGFDPLNIDLSPDEFDEPKHETVWRAMLTVAESGNQPDPISVRLALGPLGDSAASWLGDVFTRPVVPANAPALATRIRHASQLRRIGDLARGVLAELASGGTSPDLLVEKIRRAVDNPVGVVQATQTLGDAFPRVIDQIQRGQAAGRSTPWPELDKLIHGLADDRLYIVAARPGVGKSLLGQNLAMHWSRRHGLPVYFASLEMTADELTMRTIAQAARVPMDSLLSGNVSEAEWDQITKHSDRITSATIHIADSPGQTLDQIRNGARQLQRRSGLGLVVVDYLQLVTARDRRIPREQQVSEISRGLKLMAKELHVPVVALSQVRRLNEGEANKRPSLSDLRESGAIEQDADVVMILHIPDPANHPSAAELIVAKARAGRREMVRLELATHYAMITPAQRLPVHPDYRQEAS